MQKAIITKVKSGRQKGQFRFKLMGVNGEQVGSSGTESYHNRSDIIATLVRYFPQFTIEDITKKQN